MSTKKCANLIREVNVNILDLPNEILAKILSNLPYLYMRELQMVCKRFDEIGCSILNTALQLLPQRLSHRFQQMESLQLGFILQQMSIRNRKGNKDTFFFAGEILDKILEILNCVKTESSIGWAYTLFDLTTIKMEDFKNLIQPTTSFTTKSSVVFRPSWFSSQEKIVNLPQNKRINELKVKLKGYQSRASALRKKYKVIKRKIEDGEMQILDFGSKFEQHDKQFEEMACSFVKKMAGRFGLLPSEYQSCNKELQNLRQSCSCQPIRPSPCFPSVEELESPNKSSYRNIAHSSTSKDMFLPDVQESSPNSQDTLQPIANSKPDVSETKFLRTSSSKRKQNRSESDYEMLKRRRM